jgi:hypothetical protein
MACVFHGGLFRLWINVTALNLIDRAEPLRIPMYLVTLNQTHRTRKLPTGEMAIPTLTSAICRLASLSLLSSASF